MTTRKLTAAAQKAAAVAQASAPTAEDDAPAADGRVTTRFSVGADSTLMLDLYIAAHADDLARRGLTMSDQPGLVILQAQSEHNRLIGRHPDLARLTVCFDSRPVGRMLIDIDGSDFHLVDLSLLPDFRGLGIGTQLMGELLDEARASQMRIRLEVAKDGRAFGFFERLGFAVSEDRGAACVLTWKPEAVDRIPRQGAHR